MPIASDSTATTVKAGLAASVRHPYLTSCHSRSTHTKPGNVRCESIMACAPERSVDEQDGDRVQPARLMRTAPPEGRRYLRTANSASPCRRQMGRVDSGAIWSADQRCALATGVVLPAGDWLRSRARCSSRRSPGRSARSLLRDMKAVVSVKELMANMIDPLADNIFDAVWWENGPGGMKEHRPKTDEDWEKVSIGAVTIAEGIYLLKVPRPFAPPGDVNNSV